jgi:hypothetical protein
MLWRHLCLVRAWSAAGLLSGLMMLGAQPAAAQTSRPTDIEKITLPAEIVTETVDLLKASKAGDLDVVARGQGQDRVHLTIHNTSKKRLNVVLPAGLVAASAAGQRRGGLQSMGLGMFSNRPGSFGQFQSPVANGGLQSVPVQGSALTNAVTVPMGETLEFTVPGVCLNFGLPTPTPRDTFTLMDVDDYSNDVRVRKSLRSLALYGTSQGVAQAVMWNVCNNLPFEAMAAQAGKVMNEHEIALAARFVEAVDESSGADLVDASRLRHGRLFVQVRGEKDLASEAERLNEQLGKLTLLGLAVQSVDGDEMPACAGPGLYVRVALTDTKIGETRGQISVSYCSVGNSWMPLGKTSFLETSSLAVLDGPTLSRSLDRALAEAFVSVKPARRVVGATNLKVENHLPFTVVGIKVKAGTSAGAPTVPFEGVGVGPARSSLLPIQAATGVIERVELNGL